MLSLLSTPYHLREKRAIAHRAAFGRKCDPDFSFVSIEVTQLPPNGQPWTVDEAADWLHAAVYNLRFAYKLKGKLTVDIKVEQPGD
jgi:hypothetical protein